MPLPNKNVGSGILKIVFNTCLFPENNYNLVGVNGKEKE
jgi:hypothetical protein